RRSERRLRSRRFAARCVRLGQALFYPCPLWLALLLGEMAGLLGWMFSPRLRRLAHEHLEIAFGDEMTPSQRSRVIRRVFLQFGRSAGEILVARRTGTVPFEKDRVVIEGVANLEKALEGGRGALALAPHFGNFELLAGITRRHFDLRVVGRKKREDDPIDAVEDTRRMFDLETLPQTQPRAVLRALKKNALVGILPDQDVDRVDGIFLPFFGKEAYTPSGPASISLATGAPMVPGFILREGRSRHRIVWHEPIYPNKDAEDRDAEIRRLTQAWTTVFENEIRGRPDMWVWFHRRWQTTPESLERTRAKRAEQQRRRAARAEKAAS
ncbi:MAG: lysophospholipid acyltransferase family protein, partial [Planctomycetota bacterium]